MTYRNFLCYIRFLRSLMGAVLKGVVAYIDVRSALGNPAIGLGATLESLGARVSHTLNHLVTHVIFRNGSEAVKSWALKRNIPLVSPGWVKASKMMKMKASETAYSDDCEILDLFTPVDSENSPRQCNIQPNMSDENCCTGLPIFKPIRVRENFIRPKTPPGMKDFILRIQEREKLNKEPTLLCEETILEDSKENITNEPPTLSVKEAFHEIPEKPKALGDSMVTSTQNAAVNQPMPVEFRHSLSPIFRKSQKPDTLDTSSILDDSLAEIIPSADAQQTNSHRFRLINPETYSQNDVLIIPRVQQSSTLTGGNCEGNNNNDNSKGQKLKRRSTELTKKLSFGTPLTPDVLVNFVNRSHKPKSFSVKKKQKDETMKCNNTNNAKVTPRKDQIGKSPKTFITPNKKSSNLHTTTGTPKTPRKTTAIDSESRSEPRLKSTPSTRRSKTPKRRLTNNRLTNRTPCSSKSVEKVKVKITPAKEKNPPLSSSSGGHKDTRDSNKAACEEIKSNGKSHIPPPLTQRPVCSRLPVNLVDLDETMSPVVVLTKSEHNQNVKSVQTSTLASSPFRKRLRSSGVVLSPTQPSSSDCKQRIRGEYKVTTPICRRSKRISLSQIKPISNRNSLEEFRLTPVEKCKSDVTMKSPSTSVKNSTKISIVFSGTQSEDEQLLTALLKSSNLTNYDIVKLPSNSIAANSHSSRRSNIVKPGTASRACATPHFTHLITQLPCRRTLKLFYALIRGVHICTTDWIRESVSSNMWLSESLFKPPGLPRLSRLQRMNTLFSNTGVIYVGSDTNPPRQDLVDLLSIGGAVLTNKKMEASVLIGCNVPNKMCVKVNWILDCIYQAKLLSMLDYKL
ncbi:unnamed protein product [Trichobilharzia szidati]|nr:unnamed protein product [Trichobilharzia szidati]